jgi:hypothetical protein
MKLRVPSFYIHIIGSDLQYIPTIILFGISFTLKAKKKLTTRINCFHLMIRNFPNWNFHVGHLCELSTQRQERREGQGTAAIDKSPLPFSLIQWLSPDFSHAIQINRDSKKDISIRFSQALHVQCVVCGEEMTNHLR